MIVDKLYGCIMMTLNQVDSGLKKTVGKMLQRFNWSQLQADISTYIRSCNICQRYKSVQKAPPGLIVTRYYVYKPWELISADIVGPLPSSLSGYKYVLMVYDYFSKFPLFFPVQTTTSKNIK